MSYLFLALFAIAEIALVILTFTKFPEKAAWRKNRAFIRAAETVLLLGMILLPTVHLKWRFLFALIVLIMRLLIAGIVWLVNRKKTDGLRQKPRTVISCVFSVILISFALIPSFLLTNYNGLKTTGAYRVNEVSAILIDEGRTDPFENDGSYREIPVHFYYPENSDGEYPLVVFSHGAFGYYQSNFSTYAELASNGYVVAALDHPHHSFQSWLKLRVDDFNCVLDAVEEAAKTHALGNNWLTEDRDTVLSVLNHTDTDRIGLMGHSLGGAASVAVGRERTDVAAVIDLDGTMLGETKGVENGRNVYYDEPYPVPVLDFNKERDYNDREQYKSEKGYPYVNEYVVENAKDGRTVTFSGVEHMDFTDLPLISPFLAKMLGSGDVDHESTLNTVNGIVLNWFDYYLKGEGTLDIQAGY